MRIPLLLSIVFVAVVALFGFYMPIARFSTLKDCGAEQKEVRIFRTLGFKETITSLLEDEFRAKIDDEASKQKVISDPFAKVEPEKCTNYVLYLF